MSRIAKKPICVPDDIDITFKGHTIIINHKKNCITRKVHESVIVEYIDNKIFFKPKFNTCAGWMYSGTERSLVNSMIIGVKVGFSKTLKVVGVGYKINIEKNNIINMSLGYSHTIQYVLPKDVIAESISTVEIVLKSMNKPLLGQVAANIRAKRKPEIYKGKGVRYLGEFIRIKEAKKK
ncbi:50S ribosomal protein L6 [Buchnera aphidicola]|uniref:50S ribosomal protein L6 n=1 Tax=Buchnera aphidicola (Sarucallis kahawaluokalani) TaxID=1241878 RepID=A0A4D6Y9P5_9GAMM|nr:50S ribosomal protein L6 [Buchnera aphidicola]QCI26119.1 50S ribosomal protein L6 [Buchnera aphidicola (Sarucallis kahawaluokalani)]